MAGDLGLYVRVLVYFLYTRTDTYSLMFLTLVLEARCSVEMGRSHILRQ